MEVPGKLTEPMSWVETESDHGPFRPNDLIIALMGMTGSGKSSFIKLCTSDKSINIGHDLESCKCHCSPTKRN